MDDQASRINLDAAMTEGPQGTAKDTAKAPAKRPVIAVVDDDPAVCGSLKFALELDGFAVRTFHSGAELLHAGGLKDCNCFVVDQRMPGMTGMELADALRERLVLTPVILLISHPNAALSARALKAAIPIVEKPLLGNALVERIREACRA
jgi:FixJ family two-component response regulator